MQERPTVFVLQVTLRRLKETSTEVQPSWDWRIMEGKGNLERRKVVFFFKRPGVLKEVDRPEGSYSCFLFLLFILPMYSSQNTSFLWVWLFFFFFILQPVDNYSNPNLFKLSRGLTVTARRKMMENF